MSDPRSLAAEIYNAVLNAQHDDSDAVLSEALDLLAQNTGQNKFRHAASIVRGRALGRSVIDDKAALRRVAAFPPARRREAVGVVARQVAGAHASDKRVAAIARRLRRKLREK
jgi:hypothetical protein